MITATEQPDRKVYQLLADYQAGPEGGQGYMRLLHFDQDQNRIIVNTYSPYLNDYNFYDSDKYPDKDEFVIDLNLDAQKKRIATDSFTVNVYTDTLIGKKNKVKSGKTAKVPWNRLETNSSYAWYAVLKMITQVEQYLIFGHLQQAMEVKKEKIRNNQACL